MNPDFYLHLLELVTEIKIAIKYCNAIGYFNDVMASKQKDLFKYQFGDLEVNVEKVIK